MIDRWVREEVMPTYDGGLRLEDLLHGRGSLRPVEDAIEEAALT